MSGKKSLLSAGMVTYLVLGVTFVDSGAEKVRFGTNTKDIGRYVLLAVAAQEKGLWKEQGMEAQWFPMEQSAQLYQAVSAGSVDMGTSALSSAIFASARGVPALLVADLKNRAPWYVWVRKDSPITKVEQLKGTRMGITRSGGLVHAMTATAIKGLGLEGEVKIVATGGGRPALAAVQAGTVASMVNSLDAMVELYVQGVLRPVVSILDLLPKDWTEVGIMARKGFWETDPERVRKARKAVIKAAAAIEQDRAWTLKTMKSLLGFSEEAAVQLFETLKYRGDGSLDKTTMEVIVNFLVANGMLAKDKVPRAEVLYVAEFAR